ncbi:hypothetical protein Ancab_019306, partial [Ancistrocladus abbreviatus]
VEAPSPYKHTTTPANSLPSSADHQSKGSRSDQISSRWAPRAESDGLNLEICVLHKSPASGRYVGNEARAEERDKGEKNGGALTDGQQREEGDLHGGQRMRNKWETPISLLRREKGRLKKTKRVPILHIVGSLEVPNMGCEKEGDRQQPIMKQAHTSKDDQVEGSNGPLSLHKKTTQEASKGESGPSKSSPVVSQNKKRPKKTQMQPIMFKSLKPYLKAMRRKRMKEAGDGKSNSRGKDDTMAMEGSKDDSASNNKAWPGQEALNTQEGKTVDTVGSAWDAGLGTVSSGEDRVDSFSFKNAQWFFGDQGVR